MKRTIELNGTKEQINTAIAVLTAMGVIEVVTETTETTKSTTKQSKATKTTKQSKDDFPREKYVAMAKELGCYSERRHTCWNSCRSIVYDVIGWDAENKKPCKAKLTKKKAQEKVDAIKEENGWK